MTGKYACGAASRKGKCNCSFETIEPQGERSDPTYTRVICDARAMKEPMLTKQKANRRVSRTPTQPDGRKNKHPTPNDTERQQLK